MIQQLHYLMPVWKRLSIHICREIVEDKIIEQTVLPDAQELAVQYEVNLPSLMKAVSYLQEAGVLSAGTDHIMVISAEMAREYLIAQFIKDEVPQLKIRLNFLGISPQQMCNILKTSHP